MPTMVTHRGKPFLRSTRRSLLPEVVQDIGGSVARYGLIVLALLAAALVYLLVSVGHVSAEREPVVVCNATRVAFAFAACTVIILIGASLRFHRRWGWLVVVGAVGAACLSLPAWLVDRTLPALWKEQTVHPGGRQFEAGMALQFLGSYNLATALSQAEEGETGQWLGQQIQQLQTQAAPDPAAARRGVRLLAMLHLVARLVPIFSLVGQIALIILFLDAAADVSAVAVGVKRGFKLNSLLPQGCPSFTPCDGPFRQSCSIGARSKPRCWKTPGPLCPCRCTWLADKVPGWELGGKKECPDCPVYIGHQRDKFRLIAPVVIAAAIILAVYAREVVAGLLHGAVTGVFGAAGAFGSPELMAQAQGAVLGSGLLWLATIVALVFAVCTVLRVTEFMIFRMKL